MISKKQYIQAKEIIKEYENQQHLERMERVEKIKAELVEFFKNNTVGGVNVTDFDLHLERTRMEIWINEPQCFQGITSPDSKAIKFIERIGKKHGEIVQFPYYYFPK